MSFFVNGRLETVTDGRGNTVWILGKMGIGVEAQVMAEFSKLGGRGMPAYEVALLFYNVVKWDGPDFVTVSEKGDEVPVACTKANIGKLDWKIPQVNTLFTAVLQRINELNKKAEADVSAEEAAADPISAASDS